MYIEGIKEFAKSLWGGIVGFINGDGVTASVTEEDQIELAQKIQDMGYDIVGYGFADASYEYDGETNKEEIDGFTNGKIIGISTLSDKRNYLQAYIAQSEATYILSSWNLWGQIQAGVDEIKNAFDWLVGDYDSITESDAQSYSEGLLNIITPGDDPTTIQIEGENPPKIQVDRENKLLKIQTYRIGPTNNLSFGYGTTYYFDLSNWTSLYGKPLELFLALHLGTMMPDLSYELATNEAFNTKVNIELQKVQSTFKVIYRKSDGTEIYQEAIERIYLKSVCNMTDTQINNFANAGKLDEAFIKILNSISNISIDFFNVSYNGSINLFNLSTDTYRGFNISSIERSLLGQNYNIWKNIEVIDYNGVNQGTQDFDCYIRVKDSNDPTDSSQIQSYLDGSELSGMTTEQLIELGKLILDGAEEADVYLPRIESVTKHWFYKDIDYQYGLARKAKKKVQYDTEEDANPLSSNNLNGDSIILDTTYTEASGVYYQLTEPTVEGPNDAIVALFKGGTATVNGIDYTFPGAYYRYDGTRATAQKIANAKAYNEGKATYKFQNEEYPKQDPSNSDMAISLQEVSFATEDADGNKSYNDAYAAFGILDDVHSLEAETVYRLFKELLVELNYFTKEDFMKPLTQVLLWPVERVGSDTEAGDDAIDSVTEGIYKDVNQYGLFLENGVAVNSGDTIIAPGDATVESVDGNTITLKFKTISDGNALALQSKFGTDYFDVDRDIVLDMEMTISGINASVSVGQDVTAGSTIGTATNEDMRIVMYNIDRSIVQDIETYMYPTYEGSGDDIIEILTKG